MVNKFSFVVLLIPKGTNVYIVGTGSYRLLIDTGEGRPSWIKALLSVLAKENASVSQVLITHCHLDHTGGIQHLLANFPEATVHKYNPAQGHQGIQDGEQFSVDGATLRAVHSPGHTKDHMVFVLEEEDAMFTGDSVLGQGTAVFEDLSTYLHSLEGMKVYFSGRAYPGHGPVIDDGNARISEYLRHRQQREDQVLQVLKSSSIAPSAQEAEGWVSMEIVKVIYKDVPESLHLAAHGGVLQLLRKLQGDDRVEVDSFTGKWKIKERAIL